MSPLRIVCSIIAIVCGINGFFSAPFTHQHASDDPDHHSIVHSHLRVHYSALRAQDNRRGVTDPEDAHYLDLFDALTQSPHSMVFLVTTSVLGLTHPLHVSATVLTSEARAHSPPTQKQVPARAPPIQRCPVVA